MTDLRETVFGLFYKVFDEPGICPNERIDCLTRSCSTFSGQSLKMKRSTRARHNACSRWTDIVRTPRNCVLGFRIYSQRTPSDSAPATFARANIPHCDCQLVKRPRRPESQ